MVISERIYTVDDFREYLAQHPDRLLELIDGRIVEKVTTEGHGYVVINIGSALKIWARQSSIKGYYSTETTIEFPDDTANIRQPDVTFRRTDGDLSWESTLKGMPDFAVEVVSPSNTIKAMRSKAEFYLANGAKRVWLVYPAKKLVEVYFADGEVEFFTEEETLLGGDVLPGFEMPVREIFEI